MSNNLHHVQNLLRMIAYNDATIELQSAQLVEYSKMLDAERAAVAQLRAEIAALRAQLNTVPVDSLLSDMRVEIEVTP